MVQGSSNNESMKKGKKTAKNLKKTTIESTIYHKKTRGFINSELVSDQSTAFLELLSSLTFDLVFRIRFFPKFEIDYISPSVESLTGYPPESFCKNVEFCLNLIHPEDRAYYEKLFKKKRIFKGPRELRVIHKDKNIVWFELNTITLLDNDNKIAGQAGIAKVITGRKQAEGDLKRSKERFQRIIENGPVGIFLLDENYVFLEVNKSWITMMGFASEEMIGKSFFDNIFPEDLESLKQRIVEIKDGSIKEFRIETRLRTKTNTVLWIELYISIQQSGWDKKKTIIGIATDITERIVSDNKLKAYRDNLEKKVRERSYELLLALERNKAEIKEKRRVEKNLQIRLRYEKGLADFTQSLLLADDLSEETFTNSLEYLLKASNSNSIYIFENFEDPKDGLCMRLTKEVCDKETPPKEDLKDLVSIPYSEGFESWKKAMLRREPVIRTLDLVTKAEHRFIKHGKAASLIALPIWTENTWYGFIGFDSVKKDHWWNEEDVRLLRTAAAILGVYKERRRIEREMLRQQKLESLALLAGGIAHDFNNFLSGIMLSASIAKRYVDQQNPAFEIINDAEHAAKRAANLSNQLVTFTRGGEPSMAEVSILKLLKDTVNFALTGSGINSGLEITEDLWLVNGDKGQISQVIYNIVLNALQAMPLGGNLTIKASNINLQPGNDMNLLSGDYVRISISDTGIGIMEENLSKIFDPYFTTKERGSGLGLTMSYTIIKNHKGYLGVDSIKDRGTTFFIYLPAIPRSESREEEENEKLKKGKGRVLLMDDEEVILFTARKGLTLLGYDVLVTTDGVEAVEQFKTALSEKNPFSVVILDLTVNGEMGGKEAAKRILEMDADARIIMSSGYLADPVMADYTKFGFKASLPKPYTIEELSDVLSLVLKNN